MSVFVDERAVLGKNVELGDGVTVAPFAVIDDNVTIGAGTSIGSHTFVGSHTTIGEDCRIFNGVSVGTIAQDLKYREEDAFLEIGNRTQIREFCTVNKGTSANNGMTRIGDDCALLACCHVGHDCEVGNHFVSSNNLGMAGHVIVDDHVTCGGNVSVHQFTRIGSFSFLGANQYLTMDVVPFALVGGNADGAFVASINKVGLERNGFLKEEMLVIKKVYRTLFRKGLALDVAVQTISDEYPDNEHVKSIISFIKDSERGITRMRK